MLLLAIQNLVKRREGEARGEQHAGARRGERLQPGGLTSNNLPVHWGGLILLSGLRRGLRRGGGSSTTWK